MSKLDLASFFSGVGGLDLGFENAGFNFKFANDNWKGCWESYEKNHKIKLNKDSIENLDGSEFDDVIGFVGGPPCQSWSLAGCMKGINDPRGKLIYDYIRLIETKKPLFFLTENVPGIVSKTHFKEFQKIVRYLKKIGYNITYQILNASDFDVPQDRKRVFIVGFHENLEKNFVFPESHEKKVNLKESIGDLPEPLPALDKNRPNPEEKLPILNHEYMTGSFSSMYMSRNRVRSWNEQSFTIQAEGRHIPIHPQANKMIKIDKDKRIFDPNSVKPYRRLSVRECARIQTFPDNFIFKYNTLNDGYKMIGNAVPVKLAEAIALKVKSYL